MLSWLVIAQKRKLCSISGFKGLPAADKIRWLLSTFNIDYSIPPKSAGLTLSKPFTLQDLVDVFVDVRNALVHAECNKASRLIRPNEERGDLWFKLEVCCSRRFLAVIGYQGKFVNRAIAAPYSIGGLQQCPGQRRAIDHFTDSPATSPAAPATPHSRTAPVHDERHRRASHGQQFVSSVDVCCDGRKLGWLPSMARMP